MCVEYFTEPDRLALVAEEPITTQGPTGQSSRTRYYNAPRPLLSPVSAHYSGLIKNLLLKSFNAPAKSCFSSKMAVSGEPCDWSRHSLVFRFRGGDSVSHWLCSIPHKGNPKCRVVTSYKTVARKMPVFLSFSAELSG